MCHLELLQQDRGKNLEELGGMGRERLEILTRVWEIIVMGTQKTRAGINQQSLCNEVFGEEDFILNRIRVYVPFSKRIYLHFVYVS